MEKKIKKCLKCGSKNLMEYEEIGKGKYCKKCFDEEMKIWEKEAGFKEMKGGLKK